MPFFLRDGASGCVQRRDQSFPRLTRASTNGRWFGFDLGKNAVALAP
jgi:hypothetical protein